MGFAELVRAILLSVFAPAVFAGAVLALAWWPWKGAAWPRLSGSLSAIAFAGAFAIGFALVTGAAPSFPPAEALEWLVPFAGLAAVLGVVEVRAKPPARVRHPLHALLVVGAFFLFLGRIALRENVFGPTRGALLLAGGGVAAGIFWALVDELAERIEGASVPLLLTIVASGESVVLLQGRAGVKIARLVGLVASALGASVVMAWWRPGFKLSRGALPVVVVLLACLAIGGYVLAPDPDNIARSSIALLAIAPLFALVGNLKAFEKRPPWQRTLVRVLATAVPATAAVIIAAATAPPPDDY